MTFIPPNDESFGEVVIPGTGMVPMVAADPNAKGVIWRNPWLHDGTDRNLTLTLVKFHNNHPTKIYMVAWGISFNSILDYTNDGTAYVGPFPSLAGTSDPAIQHDRFDLGPYASLNVIDRNSPVVLAPNMALLAWQVNKDWPGAPTAMDLPYVNVHITGEWGPVQS